MTIRATVHPSLKSVPPKNDTAGAWPTFLVIGAGRSGTTSLYQYLSRHPGIAMAAIKELSFFAAERTWHLGQDWYRAWFYPDDAVRGEVSPIYTAAPRFAGVPGRIHGLIPDVKLIYIVRDPIDRAVAHYAHRSWMRQESRSLDDALLERESQYVACSRYFEQLRLYLAHFALSQFLIVDQYELLHHRRRSLRRIFSFVGADPDFWDVRFGFRYHRTAQMRSLTPMGERLARTRWFRALDRLPHDVRWHLEQVLTWPVSRPVPRFEISPSLRAELTERFREDATQLRNLTGLRFETWRV